MSKWEMVRLIDTAKNKLEYGSGASAIEHDGITRYVRITDINEFGELNQDKVSPSEVDEKYVLSNGDILFARSGATVGKTYIYAENNEKCIYAGYLIRYTPNTEMVIPRYIYNYTKSPRFKNFIQLNQRAVAQPNINAKQYSEMLVPIYPLDVQKHIADTIDKVQEIIDCHKKQLEELDNLIKAAFYDMFGDPGHNPKNWNIKCIGDLFNVTSGGTPKTSKKEYWENGHISWIGSNMCQNEILYDNDGKYITEQGLKNSSAKVFPCNTVLVALVGATIGKVALLKFETATNQNVAGIYVSENSYFVSEYIYFMLQSLYHKFTELSSGGFKMANLGFVRGLEIMVPPIDLQNKFAEIVTSIEEKKAIVKKSIAESQNLFNSLMSKYFD